jgi:hypothetical protein
MKTRRGRQERPGWGHTKQILLGKGNCPEIIADDPVIGDRRIDLSRAAFLPYCIFPKAEDFQPKMARP